MFSREAISKFDYVFTDSMTIVDDSGRRMRLWIDREVPTITDKQAFMELLVQTIVGILSNEPIDIYVNPTFLPAVIEKEYDTLWTDERMDKVIQAAARNGVAIEINSRYKLPSEKFIKKAKAAGIPTFAFAGPLLPGDPERLASLLGGAADHVLIDRMNYHYADSIYRKHGLEETLSDDFFARTQQKLASLL